MNKKIFSTLLYTGTLIIGLPLTILIIVIILPTLSKVNKIRKTVVVEKVYDTVVVKKEVKIYDTIYVTKTKFLEKVKSDTLD